jgi:hypothetical protein
MTRRSILEGKRRIAGWGKEGRLSLRRVEVGSERAVIGRLMVLLKLLLSVILMGWKREGRLSGLLLAGTDGGVGEGRRSGWRRRGWLLSRLDVLLVAFVLADRSGGSFLARFEVADAVQPRRGRKDGLLFVSCVARRRW